MCNLRYLTLAKLLAAKSNYKIRVGCVIVKHGTPIAVGFNRVKSHPRHVHPRNATVHAEMDAVAGCQTTMKGATIYVYREHRDGTPALARPCANCQTILQKEGIKTMIYSTNDYPHWEKESL